MSDRLKVIVLAKDYGGRKAGSAIRVDAVRAEWLRSQKYEAPSPQEGATLKPASKPAKKGKANG